MKDYSMEGFDLSPEFKAKISEHIRICVREEIRKFVKDLYKLYFKPNNLCPHNDRIDTFKWIVFELNDAIEMI